MLASQRIEPPAQLKAEGSIKPRIGVRLLVPPDLLNLILYPSQNRIGTQILCRLLQARMELAGVRVGDACAGFQFNQAYYQFSVSKLAAGLEAVKQELEKLDLLGPAQIAWRDPREEIWRSWYPQAARFDSPSAEELRAESEFFAAIINAMEKCQRSQDEHPGQ